MYIAARVMALFSTYGTSDSNCHCRKIGDIGGDRERTLTAFHDEDWLGVMEKSHDEGP